MCQKTLLTCEYMDNLLMHNKGKMAFSAPKEAELGSLVKIMKGYFVVYFFRASYHLFCFITSEMCNKNTTFRWL